MRIVMIVVDTLRRDALGFNGAALGETPDIDELASHSCLFENYYLASFPTVPAREDMARGRYTYADHGWGPLPDAATPIAQVLANNGYVTQLLCDTPHLIGRGHRYHRGFLGYHWIRGHECDTWFTRYNLPFREIMPREKTRLDEKYFGERPLVELHYWINQEIHWEEDRFVARTMSLASKWIEQNYKAKDFLLWIDTFEPHEPWDAPEYLVERYDPGYEGPPMVYPNYGYADIYSPAEIHNMRAHYAATVTMTSKWTGHLLRKLKDVGIYDDTLIVFLSDHGTYIGEHNRTGKMFMTGKPIREHPWSHYEENLHIPMLIKMPGQRERRAIAAPSQPVDLAPSIVDLCGISSDLEFHGQSLAPLLTGEGAHSPRRFTVSSPVLLETEPNFWSTITGEGFSLGLGGALDEAPELFDLKADPGQSRNLSAERKDVLADMGAWYVDFLRRVGANEKKIDYFVRKIEKFR